MDKEELVALVRKIMEVEYSSEKEVDHDIAILEKNTT